MATLVQVNVSSGGMPKYAVLSARVTVNGIEGDRQKNRKYHGGPDRAICLYSQELYTQLQSEGVNVHPGDLGENFTTHGLDLHSLAPGDFLSVGACRIEIVSVRIPCRQLKTWHPNLQKLIEGRSGWMARVIAEGVVRPGDEIVQAGRAARVKHIDHRVYTLREIHSHMTLMSMEALPAVPL